MDSANCISNEARIPDDCALTLAWEQGTNLWSEELFRRMNTDEAQAGAYSLPTLPDSLEMWKKVRPQVLQAFKDCLYGDMPPAPDSLEILLLAQKNDAFEGLAVRQECRIICRMNDGRTFDFDMLLYIPKAASSRPPVFITLNFDGNQASGPETDLLPSRSPVSAPFHWHSTVVNPQQHNFNNGRLNYVEAIRRGYAVATAAYGDIFPDNLDGFRKSIFTLFYDDLRPDCEVSLAELKAGRHRNFGAIGAWAWGMSRIVDVLERKDFHEFAAVGHSRLGKAALWAGANDERFKLVVSNNSGHAGAALSRRNFGENLSMLWHIRSNWFCDRMARYAGLENDLPVDQHQLLALIAPRALYVASSSQDAVADPRGEFLSACVASKIWNLYGMKGLETQEQPLENVPVGNMVRYHVKKGPHSITPYDWEQYYNLADRVFHN